MSYKDQVLRTALTFLLACSRGAKPTAQQFKAMADLCGIALPMKYRLTKKEFDEIAPDSHWDRIDEVPR